jgi:hypothetical protein
MFELKHISHAAIPKALEKAVRYRLLNEPWEAESICLDVLATDPENQEALVTLLLALTDGLAGSPGVDLKRPTEILARLHDPYERHYYAGLIHERWAHALAAKRAPGHVSLSWIREAMREYEKAALVSPAGNEERLPPIFPARRKGRIRSDRRQDHRRSQPRRRNAAALTFASMDDFEDDDFEDDADDYDVEDDDEEPTVACPYCRREIHEDAQRCPYCEQYISAEDAPPARKPWWIIVGAIVCLILLLSWFFG